MSRLLLLCLIGFPALAENLLRVDLPEKATYKLAFTLEDNAIPANPKSYRKVRASGNVQVVRTDYGARLTVSFAEHYEAVEGLPAGSDLRGVSLTYQLTSDGKVVAVEGAEEFLLRANADLQRQSDSAAAQARYKQLVYLRHGCDWIATAFAGRPLERGLIWDQTIAVGGHPLVMRPVPAKLQVLGPAQCGLGDCVEIEGTFQDNVTEERAAVGQAVQSAWDSGRFRVQVHPQTGLLAKLSRFVTSVAQTNSGRGVVSTKRSIVTEVTLTDEKLPPPKPVRPTIIGSGQ